VTQEIPTTNATQGIRLELKAVLRDSDGNQPLDQSRRCSSCGKWMPWLQSGAPAPDDSRPTHAAAPSSGALQRHASAIERPGTRPSGEIERIKHLPADRIRRIYIAGPMTGLPELNFPAFAAKAAELRALGWHVENPAEHGHVEDAVWSDYMRWDLARLVTCSTVALLPGWSKSKGATLELHVAQMLGLAVSLCDGAEEIGGGAEFDPIKSAGHCPAKSGENVKVKCQSATAE